MYIVYFSYFSTGSPFEVQIKKMGGWRFMYTSHTSQLDGRARGGADSSCGVEHSKKNLAGDRSYDRDDDLDGEHDYDGLDNDDHDG